MKEGGRKAYQSKSPMSSHTMSRNANPPIIKLRERRKHSLGQFLGDVGVHVVAIVVGRLGSVDVEAGPCTEVVRVVLAFDVQSA